MAYSWCALGPLLVRSWPTPGALLAHSCCTSGPLLLRYWPTPVALLAHSWCSPGLPLVRSWLFLTNCKGRFCRFLKQSFFEFRRFSRSRIFSTVPVLPFQPFHNGSSRSSRSGPAVPRFPAVPGLAGTFLVVGRSVPRKPVRSTMFHSFPFRSGPCTSLIYIYIYPDIK